MLIVDDHELSQMFETEQGAFNAQVRAIDGDASWLADKLLASRAPGMEYAIRVATKQGVEAFDETPKVQIGTVHSVKGADNAQVVYLFPDVSPQGWRDCGMRPTDAMVRTMYVGMTRARETLVLCQGCTRFAVTW